MLRFLTAGESHGPALTAILEGFPAGVSVTVQDINRELARRQRGFGSGGRMKIEKDRVRVTSGIIAGRTTGAPIALHVVNDDWPNWQGREISPITRPRPGHADLTGGLKYGYEDLRYALERASARETTMRVAVGALCKRLLAAFDIHVGGYVVALGPVEARLDGLDYPERWKRAEENEVRCPDPEAAAAMQDAIRAVIRDKDTLGGIFEIVATGVPPGLGSHVHWDRKLEARLAQAIMSIPAIKGVEIGPAFRNARLRGSQVHDPFRQHHGRIVRPSNNAGGFEGGITTGEPVVVRAAMKPISTILKGMPSVNLATGQEEPTVYERSDFTAVPRAVVVGEAMLAFVLADALIEKLGGDSLTEMRARYALLVDEQARWVREGVQDTPYTWDVGLE
ncbi:MAG: chorismate synthase [Ardenticatenia bacterium]|nr:chorismate synthase [Ardenticatenia bacterium]